LFSLKPPPSFNKGKGKKEKKTGTGDSSLLKKKERRRRRVKGVWPGNMHLLFDRCNTVCGKKGKRREERKEE